MCLRIALSLLFCPMFLLAQNSRKIVLPQNNSDHLTLPPIARMEIFTQIGDSSILGYDISNEHEIVRLTPDTTLHQWLTSFLHNRYSSGFKNSTVNRIILSLNKLRIQLSPEGNCFVKLGGEVWLASELNDEFHSINRLDTIIVGPYADPGRMVAQAFDMLLAPLVASKINERKFKSRGQIMVENSLSYRPEVLSSTSHGQGVFLSFEEFLLDRPSIHDIVAFPDESNPNILRVYEVSPDSSRREIIEFWGLSMDNELYVKERNELIPIEQQQGFMVISSFVDPFFRKNQAYFRRVVGKQTGVSIYNTQTACSKSSAKATLVDLKSGELTF